MPTELQWFRRDLRLHDNPALDAAADADALLPLFVLHPHLLRHDRVSPARLIYLRQALEDLGRQLADRGSRLVVRVGDPAEVVPAVAAEVDATRVHICADHTPYAVVRDDAVEAALESDGRTLERHEGVAIAPPGSVLTGSGSPYKVFTPFHRSWRDHRHGDPLPAPAELPAPPADVDGVQPDAVRDLQVEGPPEPWPPGGEIPARDRLDAWLATGVDDYEDTRDVLGIDGTSRLSPDLHFGCLSAREVHSRLDRRNPGQRTFATELAWRDFYLHVMAAWPEVAATAFREDARQLPWREDEDAFDAWREGRTGYPVVDAAMRQLATLGWMHNRARMVVASFLCKDLLIDWRWGEGHFLANLVDGDPSSNNGGWQWAAGTGTDAQPFFRIFNPVSQGERFDPDGAYVRRYVPELAPLDDAEIHAPWTMSEDRQHAVGVVIGRDYPAPIVDHAEARLRALAWFERHRG